MLFLIRLLLAALHYNENAERQQAMSSTGKPLFTIRFLKFKKGEYSVVPIKQDTTYGIVAVVSVWLKTELVDSFVNEHT